MLIAGALLASAGCDSQGQQGDQKKKAEKSEAEEPKEAEQEQEQSDEEQAETEAEYAEEDYVQASYELSCVESELSEDEVEFEKVEKDILGKYGFDQKTYESADEEYGESDEVSGKIDSKLEDCTTEQARQFAGMGEQEESEKEDSGEKQGSEKAEGSSGSPKPANVGTMSKTIEGSAGFERAELKVTVREDFSANGTFSGRREGKGFRISLDGKVSDDNDLSLSGSSGKNDVSVDGKLKESGTKAKVSGSLWERQFTTTMSLN
jgi:hypothetical protein